MPHEPEPDASLIDPEEPEWAAEIKRLRAGRGDRLAEQLADDDRKEPPVE
jgi:hypothetical protein